MSNALAIATVTQALALLIESNLRPEIDFAVSVETRKPPAEPPTDPTITVFLYQVAPNPSLRNTDLPSRASGGGLLARPTAALDLHYLISAYGEETELVGQRLIGCVVRTLQEIPVLPRELLVEAASRPYLAGSDLADSPQRVRFSPIQMDTDETSKLWGMLHQTPYALSTTYQGSLVLIEGREKPVPPKPVERVVPTARPFPPVAGADEPAARTGAAADGAPGATEARDGSDETGASEETGASDETGASGSDQPSEPERQPEADQPPEPEPEPEADEAPPERRTTRTTRTTPTKRSGTSTRSTTAKRGTGSTRRKPPANKAKSSDQSTSDEAAEQD